MALNLPRVPDGVPAELYEQFKIIYDALHMIDVGGNDVVLPGGGGGSSGGGGPIIIPPAPEGDICIPHTYKLDADVLPNSIVSGVSPASNLVVPCSITGEPAFGFCLTGGKRGDLVEILSSGLFLLSGYSTVPGIQFRGNGGQATRSATFSNNQVVGYSPISYILLFLPQVPVARQKSFEFFA